MTIGEIQSMQQEETSADHRLCPPLWPRRCVSARQRCYSTCTPSCTWRSRGSSAAPVGTRVSVTDAYFRSGAATSTAPRCSLPQGGWLSGQCGKASVGGQSRSWEAFNGCILQPRLAPLLNSQLIGSKLLRADGGGAGSTCLSALEDGDVAGGDNKVTVYKGLPQSCD